MQIVKMSVKEKRKQKIRQNYEMGHFFLFMIWFRFIKIYANEKLYTTLRIILFLDLIDIIKDKENWKTQ